MPGSKQGPVRLTIVPPNMFPFSGANTSGKLAPIRSLKDSVIVRKYWRSILKISNIEDIGPAPDADAWQYLLVDAENVSTWKAVGHPSVRQVSHVGGLREGFLHWCHHWLADLRVWHVGIRLRSVASVESDKGGHTSLIRSRIDIKLKYLDATRVTSNWTWPSLVSPPASVCVVHPSQS